MGQVSKVDAGENLDAEIGSDASNLNRGTVLGLGCDGGTKRGGSFFGGHEGYLLLAMLHKPAFDFFADVTDVVKKIDFLLSNKYLENEN